MNNQIIKYLDKLFPNPKCELTYNKDYELLIKVMLSAQTTDKRVNMVGDKLFSCYPTLESLSKAEIENIEQILRPIGTYHKKALNTKIIAKTLIEKFDSKVPYGYDKLESMPGIGRKSCRYSRCKGKQKIKFS